MNYKKNLKFFFLFTYQMKTQHIWVLRYNGLLTISVNYENKFSLMLIDGVMQTSQNVPINNHLITWNFSLNKFSFRIGATNNKRVSGFKNIIPNVNKRSQKQKKVTIVQRK